MKRTENRKIERIELKKNFISFIFLKHSSSEYNQGFVRLNYCLRYDCFMFTVVKNEWTQNNSGEKKILFELLFIAYFKIHILLIEIFLAGY